MGFDALNKSGEVVSIIVGILAIVGFLTPIFVMAFSWKLQAKFALRTEVRGMAKRLNRKIEDKTSQLDTDLREGLQRLEDVLTKAIKESHESTCKDINGLGEKWQATLKVAETAVDNADHAQHQVDLLQQQVHSIDENGTKAMRQLEGTMNQLRLELEKHRKD